MEIVIIVDCLNRKNVIYGKTQKVIRGTLQDDYTMNSRKGVALEYPGIQLISALLRVLPILQQFPTSKPRGFGNYTAK